VTRDKRKGKAPVRGSSPAVEAEEAQSEPGLEFDEEQSVEESDDSGSDFVGSEVEADASENDSEAEALMLDAAVRMSFETNRKAASSSATQLVSPNPAAVLRAAAAERRLTRANKDVDVDDYPMGGDDDNLSSDDESDVPLSKKGKGAAKKGKKGVTVHDTTKKKHMTLTELRHAKRADRREHNAEQKELKAAQRVLRAELGRQLTYVSHFTSFSCELSSISTKAERSALALNKFHPELKDVWGDLEDSIPIVVPKEAKQPKNLKLTLLPFQKEGLTWMRKQEKGIWHGGMLAVCIVTTHMFIANWFQSIG
jgi:DNA repair protein RAD16